MKKHCLSKETEKELRTLTPEELLGIITEAWSLRHVYGFRGRLCFYLFMFVVLRMFLCMCVCVCFDVVTGWALCRLHGKSYIMFSGFGFGSKRLGLRVEMFMRLFGVPVYLSV